jgi:hypothetical protein
MKKQKINLNNILEQTRKKGRNGDTILAHINPLEAMMLKKAGGSGTINPNTGLPEFGLFNRPGKWLKSVAGGGLGVIAGNMLLPGIGGVIGGALGGAAGSAMRGRKDYGAAALRGGLMGVAAPTAAGLLGSGATAMGATGTGAALSKYGATNAILPSIGLGAKTASALEGGSTVAGGLSAAGSLGGGNGQVPTFNSDYDPNHNYGNIENYQRLKGEQDYKNLGFFDKTKHNAGEFLSKPTNLLALGSAGLSVYDRMNQPKPLTAKQRGQMAKEERLAARLTPEELMEQEAYELQLEQGKRRNNRKKFLPEERIAVPKIYNKVSSPEEYQKTGRWINYYDNPQHTGTPVTF